MLEEEFRQYLLVDKFIVSFAQFCLQICWHKEKYQTYQTLIGCHYYFIFK